MSRQYLSIGTVVQRLIPDDNGLHHLYEIVDVLPNTLDRGHAGYRLQDITEGIPSRRHWSGHERMTRDYEVVSRPEETAEAPAEELAADAQP